MGLKTWINSILQLIKKSNEESNLQALRKEIEKLQKENRALKEKIIVFPQKNNENIPIKFHDENIEEVIIRNISKAKEELCIAVAWFTSKTLMDELGNLKKKGVVIKVIISEAKDNNYNLNKLKTVCNIMKKAVIPTTTRKERNGLMHNKYCIIDNKTVIDGSYNWSKNAMNNEEHVIIIESRTVAKMYKENFDKIYNNPDYYKDTIVNYKLG